MKKGSDIQKINKNFEAWFNAHQVTDLARYFGDSVSVSRDESKSHAQSYGYYDSAI